ncbi:MAG: FAD-dependent oxidoreductase, partial [Bacilli bacterium]
MEYDVIVCGAGPSGMVAAISAKRNHAKVLLVETSGLL